MDLKPLDQMTEADFLSLLEEEQFEDGLAIEDEPCCTATVDEYGRVVEIGVSVDENGDLLLS